MKAYKNFNRHECFNEETFDIFSSVFRRIRRSVDNPSLENKLYGIYDGFLYDGLVEKAKAAGADESDVELLSAVVDYIEAWIEIKGELSENEVHCINLGLV
jgi:hypothetical protein